MVQFFASFQSPSFVGGWDVQVQGQFTQPEDKDIESFVKVMIEDFAAPEVLGDVTSLQGEISGVVRRLLDKAMAAKASFCFKIRRLMHNTSGTGKGSPPAS